MNRWKLLLRSLVYFKKIHVWVVLGTIICSAILVGALIIGDSVRNSLRKIVLDRLGTAEFALSVGDRLFRAHLADDLSQTLGAAVAPLLQINGMAVADGGIRRVNSVRIVGVDERFGQIGGVPDIYSRLPSDSAIINAQLSSRLGIGEGDEILVRFQKMDVMPRDAPLSQDAESTLARRFIVKAVAEDWEFGRFNLRADQVAPSSVFVSLSFLSADMGFAGRANTLLVASGTDRVLDLEAVNDALKTVWTPSDAGLEIREIMEGQFVELRTNRVFLDPPVVHSALQLSQKPQPLLTYFVNEIRSGDSATPYSFVSAPGSPIVPPDLRDDEVVFNSWLADDLKAGVGDRIRLTYFILGLSRDLEEKSSEFLVKAVVPLTGMYADRDLLPDFPGLSDQENCRDWDPGIPIDLDKIRDKDEDYWDNHRGTPKAFITLNAAQEMWANRFGNLTAVRYPDLTKEEIEEKLKQNLDPASLGLFFRAVKEEGLRASSKSVDFAQLFLGLSFFIIVAALLLTGLLYVFNTERRAEENGLFLALGFSKRAVRGLVLREGAVLVVIGSLLGCLLGILYNWFILNALKTVWSGAVGTSALHIHLRFKSIVVGALLGMIVAFFTLWLVTRKQIRQSIAGLQKGQTEIAAVWRKKPRVSRMVGLFSLVGVIGILIITGFGRGNSAFAFFFTAGILILVGGMAWINVLLFFLSKKGKEEKLSLMGIGVRNSARKRVRSLALVGLLACGLFIVFTVGANRINALKDAEKRESGTGGFAFFGESAIPVLYDLNSPKGIRFYGLERTQPWDVRYVQFRMKEGDDASCLNLNGVSSPRLIGVDPEELAGRKAFTFVETTDVVDPAHPWSALDLALPDGSVPAVADLSVIVWGLGKSVGDSLVYLDERGEEFRIRLVGGLANSVFQGNVIISEQAFIQKFPSISGYRLFLIDAPAEHIEEVAEGIFWALQDSGLDLVPAATRLAEFNTVQNTYLSIFLILGSFGLLLGSFGLGIVVWRNVKEREGEIALLRAVGYSRKSIQTIVLSEHLGLLAAGIFLGIVAALLASLPSLLTPGGEIPYLTILIVLIIVGLNGGIWTYVSTFLATRADLIPALRRE